MSKHLYAVIASLALFATAAFPATGCGTAKNAGNAVIDCLAADRAKIGATIIDLGTKTKPDGSHDWAAVAADAIANGAEIGGCALAEFVQSYLAPASGVKAPSDSIEARQTLEQFRTTKAGGATFKTRFGAL